MKVMKRKNIFLLFEINIISIKLCINFKIVTKIQLYVTITVSNYCAISKIISRSINNEKKI